MKRCLTLILVLTLALSCAAVPAFAYVVGSEEPQHTLSMLVQESHSSSYLKNGLADYEEYPVWQAFEEMLVEAGIQLDIELISAEQYQVVVQTRMASATNLPDIVEATPLGSTGIVSIAKYGVVHDLIPLIEQYSNGNIMNFYENEFPFAKAVSLTPEGNLYWFTSMYRKEYEGKSSPTGVTFSMRKDWLDKLGLAVPTTIDEFADALIAFREQDANGNGQQDEVLSFDLSTFGSVLPQMFGLGTSAISVDVANRQIVSPWLQDGIKPYIEFVRKLVAAGVIDPAMISSAEIANQRRAENRVGAAWTWVTTSDINLLTGVTDENAEAVTLMPINAMEDQPLYVYSEEPQGTFNYFVITNQCDDLEGAIKLFDLFYTEEFANLTLYGVEGVTYVVTEDGVKALMENVDPTMTVDRKFEEKRANGVDLWNNILPRVQFMDLRRELLTIDEAAADVTVAMAQMEHWYPMYTNAFLAMGNEEENERVNELLNGINTYSTELLTKLCLDQLSLDDWDSYLEELEALGLSEVMALYQTRLDRYFEIMDGADA